MKFFSLKRFKKQSYDEDDNLQAEDEYVELNSEAEPVKSSKILVRPFVMNDFSDIKPVLDSLREGNTIALVNIRPLKEKDLVELKRAVNKLKKTTDAVEGDIAGFGDDYVVITPSFAQIYRQRGTPVSSVQRPQDS
ncbi:cell division protein SepF, partial [Candidatus Woesearchaeota archaeon]|nr:cell division protein SepF [Candidatus Woesearchaeota archaeon]